MKWYWPAFWGERTCKVKLFRALSSIYCPTRISPSMKRVCLTFYPGHKPVFDWPNSREALVLNYLNNILAVLSSSAWETFFLNLQHAYTLYLYRLLINDICDSCRYHLGQITPTMICLPVYLTHYLLVKLIASFDNSFFLEKQVLHFSFQNRVYQPFPSFHVEWFYPFDLNVPVFAKLRKKIQLTSPKEKNADAKRTQKTGWKSTELAQKFKYLHLRGKKKNRAIGTPTYSNGKCACSLTLTKIYFALQRREKNAYFWQSDWLKMNSILYFLTYMYKIHGHFKF